MTMAKQVDSKESPVDLGKKKKLEFIYSSFQDHNTSFEKISSEIYNPKAIDLHFILGED